VEGLIDSFTGYIAVWGYPVICIGLMLANVGVPLPSEITLGFAGYLVCTGRLNFAPVIVSGLVGELIGASLAYAIGYYGGTAFIAKYGRLFSLSLAKIDRSRRLYEKYGAAAIFLGRLLPIVRGVIAIPAGFLRVDFGTFFLATGFSSAVWVVVLVYMGQLFGENWRQVNQVGHGIGKVVLISVVLAVIGYVLRKKRLRRYG